MSITELKDRLGKFGCGISSHNGEINVVENVPVDIADIDNGSVFFMNMNNHLSNKQRLAIKNLCEKYYHERNGR